jgi:hypothetical protein
MLDTIVLDDAELKGAEWGYTIAREKSTQNPRFYASIALTTSDTPAR